MNSANAPNAPNAPKPPERHTSNLDNRFVVAAVYFAVLGTLAVGLVLSPVKYSSPDFAAEFFSTEVVVGVLCALATFFVFSAREFGLRRPQHVSLRNVFPVLVLAGAGFSAWGLAWLGVPGGRSVGWAPAARTLATTSLVGFSEEWMYRGVLLVAFGRAFGLRKGARLALVMFGALHLLNMIAGVPPLYSLVQFCMTIVIGSSLLLVAIRTRSLVIPIVAHALYDFFVIDAQRAISMGGPSWPTTCVIVALVVVGAISIASLWRLEGDDPYGEKG